VVQTAAEQSKLLLGTGIDEAARTATQKQIEDWQKAAARYSSEPETGEGSVQLSARAIRAEEERDLATTRYHHFELGSAAFQIAIVLASAAIIIHAIADNYAAHKHPKVRAWLARHPRWTFHFTPTSASWLNAVEGFFAKLTKRRLKRGVFRSIVELQAAINRFLAEANDDPNPSDGPRIQTK
jgi:hypothetical protein